MPLNLTDIEDLREPISQLLEKASRINVAKPERYWYPLSVATYDVEEILGALDSLCAFRTTMWEKTALFEEDFAKNQKLRDAIMVNSGSSADLVIMFALTNPMVGLLQSGDEVLLPSVTWPTQVWSCLMAGLQPRLIDTNPETLNMSLDDLERKIGPRTRAISATHLMGNPCDMDRLQRLCSQHGLVLVEDCCESLGATFKDQLVGTFGIASSFSFFFSHHITTMEGGAVCTADPRFADVCRLLRAHGWARNTKDMELPASTDIDPRYLFLNWGFNLRPTELQAAFGSVQLTRLPSFNSARKSNASHLQKAIVRFEPFLSTMRVDEQAEASWFAFPILVGEEAPFSRKELVSHLETNGIETRPVVAGSLQRHPASQMFPVLLEDRLPGADFVHDRGCYIGIHPYENHAHLQRISEVIEKFMTAYW